MGIFHILQITVEIYIYEPTPKFLAVKVIMSSRKEKTNFWRTQSLQGAQEPCIEISFKEICDVCCQLEYIAAPIWKQPNENLLIESFLLNKTIDQLLGHHNRTYGFYTWPNKESSRQTNCWYQSIAITDKYDRRKEMVVINAR